MNRRIALSEGGPLRAASDADWRNRFEKSFCC